MGFVEIDKRTRDKEWSMSELQSHSYFEVYFLLEGSRRLFIEDKMYDISAPTVCVIPPFCMHKTEGGAYSRININVSADCLCGEELDLLYKLGKGGVYRLDKSKASFFIDLLERSACFPFTSPGEDLLTLSFVRVLLAFLDTGFLNPHTPSEQIHMAKGDQTVMQAVTYIKKRFNEDFSLEELCESLFVSKNLLCSKFRGLMNCSIMEYRTFMRISKAKELLISTGMDIGSIAEQCGYSSANYFSLIFKIRSEIELQARYLI